MAAIFALIFTSTLLLATVSPPQPSPPLPALPPLPPSPPDCTDELVSFSPCLGYVSAEPNNLTDNPTPQCCDAFYNALNSTDGNCFCYLMRQPLIFGFPLNDSRVFSLLSVCNSSYGYGGLSIMDGGSLESICSGLPALPPLRSTSGGGTPKAPDSDPDYASPPSTSFPADNNEISPMPDAVITSPGALNLPAYHSSHSSAMKNISNFWFLPGTLTALAIFFYFS